MTWGSASTFGQFWPMFVLWVSVPTITRFGTRVPSIA